MDLGLAGKVALVAAGSKGLGRAVAEELAAEGATVAICARGQAAIDETVTAMSERGPRALGITSDVSVPGEPERVVAETLRVFGRIDILVTNSGGPKAGRVESLAAEDWDAATRILLSSVVGFVRAALPGMRERRWGRILNITSIAAKQPIDGLVLSNSLRMAVIAYARTLANEVATDGITVNNLLPGYTRTERVVDLAEQMAVTGGITPAEFIGRWEAEIPMHRIGEPREFAAAAAFLASERASYITGQSLAIDGGWIRALM
ncbi:MAG TPA: SDR family oxidoreductase [Vicinamibacterales bacterium]|nr:SDR family oxidoreductase [Vicinamibacterales bacterium]